MSAPELLAVMPMHELQAGVLHACSVDGLDLLVCQMADGVHVVENRCSHAASRLDGGALRNGEVTCPLHGARFRLRDGKAMCAPARKPIRVFAVVQQDDTLHIVKPPPAPARPNFGPLG